MSQDQSPGPIVTVTCPCCKATNTAGPACRRCKADLSLLFGIAARRAYLVSIAADRLRSGDGTAAEVALDQAAAIQPGEDLRRFRALARLLAGDFPAAWALAPAGPP